MNQMRELIRKISNLAFPSYCSQVKIMKLKRIVGAFLIGIVCSCSSAKEQGFASKKQTRCIDRVLEADSSIGSIRNKQCETVSLSQTILNYAEAMTAVSTQNCPEAFTDAYESHRQAWLALLPITDKYPAMRGEMHVLFRQLEQTADAEVFKKKLAKIWATWAEVEKFVQK